MSEAIQQWVEQWEGIWALQMTDEMVKEMENERLEEEKLENGRSIAQKMVASDKMTINEIIDYLDLPVAEVEKLAEEDSIKMNEYGARSLMLVLFDDPQIMKNHDAYLTRTVTERVIKRVTIMSIKKIMYKLHLTEENKKGMAFQEARAYNKDIKQEILTSQMNDNVAKRTIKDCVF